LSYFSFEQLLATEFPPEEYILSPLIEKGGLYMVYGPAGLGKTWFTAGLAVAAASGKPFLKWSASRPYRVAYIDGEMPGRKMQWRLQSISKALGADPGVVGKNLFYLGRTTQDAKALFPDLANPGDHPKVVEFLRAVKPDLVILDNLFTLCRSGDRNDVQFWDGVQEFLLDQRARGRSVIAVQHTNKANGYHGTSAQSVVMDEMISLEFPGEPNAQGARFVVKFTKARNATGDDAAPLVVDVNQSLDDPRGIDGYSWRPLEDDPVEGAVRLLRTGHYRNQGELGKALGKDRTTVSRHLRTAQERGLISASEVDTLFAKARGVVPAIQADIEDDCEF
ncbi:AAA family ATPase, partial [Paramagnetospirillum marisnigri]|uniref:AAA family ATPase n=1 Tax=Paramagnetospirillum marisnigri TaxID=1285242 RepID=UPI000A4EBC4B